MDTYNAITLISGQIIWITQAECDTITTYLLTNPTGAQAFVQIPRLKKTYNLAQIASVGSQNCFQDPLVAGGQFSFAYNGMWAKLQDKEYAWNKGWKYSRGSFSSGMSFDDYIASTIIS